MSWKPIYNQKYDMMRAALEDIAVIKPRTRAVRLAAVTLAFIDTQSEARRKRKKL